MGKGGGRGETPELECPVSVVWEARWGLFSQPQRPVGDGTCAQGAGRKAEPDWLPGVGSPDANLLEVI